MKNFINSILCLGLVSMIVSVDITNAKQLSEYQNPVNIEKIADEMNVTTEDLVETFLNLDSYLNEVESKPEMLTISDEGETVSQQVIRLDNGLLIVKETEIESIVPYATTKELHTHYFVKDPLGASTAVNLTILLQTDYLCKTIKNEKEISYGSIRICFIFFSNWFIYIFYHFIFCQKGNYTSLLFH